jgi:hypothetical protein
MPDPTSQTQQAIAAAAAAPLVSLSGEDIYDMIMAAIEPELMTVNIPQLEEMYQDETPEARGVRFQHYTECYRLYDEAYAQWSANLKTTVDQYRKSALRSAEEESREAEQAKMEKLLSSFEAKP